MVKRYVIELTEAEREAVISAIDYAKISQEYEGASTTQQLVALDRADAKVLRATLRRVKS